MYPNTQKIHTKLYIYLFAYLSWTLDLNYNEIKWEVNLSRRILSSGLWKMRSFALRRRLADRMSRYLSICRALLFGKLRDVNGCVWCNNYACIGYMKQWSLVSKRGWLAGWLLLLVMMMMMMVVMQGAQVKCSAAVVTEARNNMTTNETWRHINSLWASHKRHSQSSRIFDPCNPIHPCPLFPPPPPSDHSPLQNVVFIVTLEHSDLSHTHTHTHSEDLSVTHQIRVWVTQSVHSRCTLNTDLFLTATIPSSTQTRRTLMADMMDCDWISDVSHYDNVNSCRWPVEYWQSAVLARLYCNAISCALARRGVRRD